jgi:hypothetical protein
MFGLFRPGCHLLLAGVWQSFDEGLSWRSAVHAASLMRTAGVADDEVIVQHALHFLNGLEPGSAALHPEVLVEQGAVEALDDAVGLRPLHPCRAVPDLATLQTLRVALLKVRYAGVRTVEYDGKRISYATDAEMATALLDLERRIAASPRRAQRPSGRYGSPPRKEPEP